MWYKYFCPRCRNTIELMWKRQEVACSNSHPTARMVLESPESDAKPSGGGSEGGVPEEHSAG